MNTLIPTQTICSDKQESPPAGNLTWRTTRGITCPVGGRRVGYPSPGQGGTQVLARRPCPWGIPRRDMGPETGVLPPERTWDQSLERNWEPKWGITPHPHPGGRHTESITSAHPSDAGCKNRRRNRTL